MESHFSLVILLSLAYLSTCNGSANMLGSSGSYTDTLLNGIRRLENQARRKAAAVTSVVANTVFDECYPRCPIGTICSRDFGTRRCIAAPVAAVGTNYNAPVVGTVGSSYHAPAIAGVGSGYHAPSISAVGSGYHAPAISKVGSSYPVPAIANVGTSYNAPAISSVGTSYSDPLVATVGSAYHDPLVAPVVSSYNSPAVASVGTRYGSPVVPVVSDYPSGVVFSGAGKLGGVGLGAKATIVGTGLGYGQDVRRIAGCGIVPPECRANQVKAGVFNAVSKYTFDYTLARCVRISVCSTCALVSGVQDNLFNSLFSCNRACQLH